MDSVGRNIKSLEARAECLFWQNKKLVDDNKYFVSNIHKFRNEEIQKTKNILARLFGILCQEERNECSPASPHVSYCTYQTETTDTKGVIRGFKQQESFRKINSKSFNTNVTIGPTVFTKLVEDETCPILKENNTT